MSIFGNKRKISLGRNKTSNSSSDDFDFDSLDEMSDEFGDDHNVSTDRKATIKNYVTDHYKNKFTDRSERKKLIKQALPPSYSGPVDLAHDLKDDYDQIKYEVGKEWEKVKSPLKKALKQNEKYLRFARLNKLANWAGEDSSSRYQEEEANQDEALVQSMLAEFTNPAMAKEQARRDEAEQKVRQEEREDASEFRSQSLSLQLQGASNTGNAVAELRKLTNYQDQVTFLYQKKSLEVGIRSLLEHKKATELLRTLKDEAIPELKEIHKNTGLPEAVKINQSEMAAQILKEKMIGKAAMWFDGKAATLRKRITNRVRDKLTEMTRDFGSSLSSWNEMMETAGETGDTTGSLLGKMGADAGLNKLWDKATGKPLNWIRQKVNGNARLRKLGLQLNAMSKNGGTMLNDGLLSGSSGNKMIDGFMDWMGMRQAAVTRSDNMRGSLAQNLDTAQYMDVKFKQSVERVIPGWLSLIYKETHLLRTGQKDDKNFEDKHWSWEKEEFISTKSLEEDVSVKAFDKNIVKDFSVAMERLLRHYGSYLLEEKTKEKLKDWVYGKIRASRSATLYHLLLEVDTVFKDKERDAVTAMVQFKGDIYPEDLEDIYQGFMVEGHLMGREKYSKWVIEYATLAQEVAGKQVINWDEIQRLADAGHVKTLEKMGLLKRNSDGSIDRNMDFEKEFMKKYTKMEHRQAGKLKEGESQNIKGRDGRMSTRGTWEIDEVGSDADLEDYLQDGPKMDKAAFRALQMILSSDVLEDRRREGDKRKLTNALQTILNMTQSEANGKNLLDDNNRASGGFIRTYAKGGRVASYAKGGSTGDDVAVDEPVHATLHGGEFVTDKTTTDKNKKLLAFMNKFKASVVLPDGTVNPVYYKAFGFNDEEEFNRAHRNTDLNLGTREMVRDVKSQGALPYIQSLFTSIDLSRLSDAEINAITNPKSSDADTIRFLSAIKEKQAKRSKKERAMSGAKVGLSRLSSLIDENGEFKSPALSEDNEAKKEKLIAEGKEFFQKTKKSLSGKTDEQLEKVFWELAKHTDPLLLTEEDHVQLEDPTLSWKDKILLLTKINYHRGNRGQMVGQTFSKWTKTLATSSKSRLKNFINGSDTDSTNTDNIKKIGSAAAKTARSRGSKAWNKIKDVTTVSTSASVGKDVAFCYFFNSSRMETAFTVAQMRAGLVWYIKPREERAEGEQATVVFIKTFADVPKSPQELMSRGITIWIVQDASGLKAEDWSNYQVLKTVSKDAHIWAYDRLDQWTNSDGSPIDLEALVKEESSHEDKRQFIGFNREARAELVGKAMQKLRVKKAHDLALKAWKDEAVDIYIIDNPGTPRLTAVGFSEGIYIDRETGRVCASHHDITGAVVNITGDKVYLTPADFEKGFCDAEGNPIEIHFAKRYRNMAKEQVAKAYNKYAKKHVDRLGGGLLSLTEKWQNMFKEHAIDLYVGEGTEPRLTAVGFKEGKYFSATTKKPVMGYLDIDGPIMDANGKYLLTKEELESSLLFDKDGNTIKPPKLQSNLERLKNIAIKAVKIDKALGFLKKGWGKLKSFNAKRMANNFAKAGMKAVDVFINGEPRLLEKDFKAGKLIDVSTGKTLASHYEITGPVALVGEDGASKIVLSKEELEQGGFTDIEGKPLPAVKLDFLRSNFYRGMGKGAGSKLGKKFADWKAKAKAKFAGESEGEDGEKKKGFRLGSWQWKREQAEKDSWIGKLAGVLGGGKKDKATGDKKKSWLGKILGGITLLGGMVTKGLFSLGGLLTKGLFSSAGFLAKHALSGMARLAGWIVAPLVKGLGFLGTKIISAVRGNGLMGKFGGKAARLAGAAGGAYLAYQGLKGEDKLDENGNPVLDENGQPVKERSYGQAALGAGMMAMSIPGAMGVAGSALGMAGTGLAAAAGFLAPIALPLAAAAAVGYAGYKAFGWWKKRSAQDDYPLTSFRMNQYGFNMTDQTVMDTISKLEATLEPNVVFNGDKANFKPDIDVEAVFSVFGLKFQGGNAEKNKVFLTWFLGRFKPVYIAYMRAMKSIKNVTSLVDMEKKLTPVQSLQLLDKVHFKNQSDLNPYNIMVSPFEDPDECDYDFDDIGKKYEAIKEILKEKSKYALDGNKSVKEADEAQDNDKWSIKNIAKTAFKYSPAGAAVWAIKKAGNGIKDALSWVSEGLGKTFGGMWDKFNGVISKKWQSFKDSVKGIWDALSHPLEFAKKMVKGGVDAVAGEGSYDKAVEATSNAIETGANAVNSAGEAVSNAASAVGKGWRKLTGKTSEMQKAVYNSFIRAGLSPNQAKAITAEVGRENDYNPKVIFGSHVDPASGGKAISNLGMISWNGPRGAALAARLKEKGLLGADGKMVESQEALDVQTQFAVDEMKGPYAKRLTNFWSNPNADPNSMAPELGKKYVVWAYGQTKLKNGKSFDWKSHDNKRRGYLEAMGGSTGDGGQQSTTSPATSKIAPATAGTSPASSSASVASSTSTPAVKGGTASASAKGSTAPATSSVAQGKNISNGAGAAGALAICTPELIALGKTHYRLKDNKVTLGGMNETFMSLFWAMLGEAKQKGCANVQINEGVRSYAEQCRLYDLYCSGKGPLAAKPGTSRHGKGEAMDINTVNADELDKKGLLAKYGFSRPLMKKLKSGKMTETWHIENKWVPKAGGSAPKYGPTNDPNAANGTTAAPTSNTTGTIGGRSPVTTGNDSLNKVVSQGGGESTANVATAQQTDAMNNGATVSLLTKQLNVQTQIQTVLVEIRDHLVKQTDNREKAELEKLKKPRTNEELGVAVAGNVAELLANKFGLNKPAETPKPVPVISTRK